MSAGGSERDGTSESGRRPFFNDRRFTVAGPQRLRQNVQDLLSQFNRQFVSDNPQLLHELADQLTRLQELISTNPNGNNGIAQRNQQNLNVMPAAAATRQVRNAASTDDRPGPSNTPTDLLAEFESNVDRLRAVEDQFMSDDEDRSDEIAVENGNVLNGVPVNDSVVLNMEIDSAGNVRVETTEAAATAQAQQPQNAAGDGAAVNADAEWQRLVASLRAPEMQRIIRTVWNFGPFVFILLTKWMLTHAAGMILLAIFLTSFFYIENVIELVVASSRTQPTPKWRLLSAVIVMLLNIGALYIFSDDQLYLALLFQPTASLIKDGTGGISFLELLWLVAITDYVAKFIFMMVKCLVASGPTLVASRRRKAQTYQWLEYTSHIYRHWLPTVPWSYYLTTTGKSAGYVHNGLCTILFLAYLVLKVKLFRPKVSRWWKSMVSLLRPSLLGYSPSTTDLMKTGPTCSICYGEFANPVQLSCTHIFCEECVTTWLDKQKTCPMCRTQVITGDNDWKDGKTSYCIQLV